MLTLSGGNAHRDCCGLSRRDLLTAGTLAVGGLSLPWLLRNRASPADSRANYVRDKAVIVVFLAGGASHIETFNPNMDAPDPYRSVTGELQTSLPGLTIGGTFPLLARQVKPWPGIVDVEPMPAGSDDEAADAEATEGADS